MMAGRRSLARISVAVALAVVLSGLTVGAVAGSPAPTAQAAQSTQPAAASQDAALQNESEPTATLRFDDQTSNGSAVTVTAADLSAGGFVAIYNTSGYLLGASPYLESGPNENVTVTLGFPIESSERNGSRDQDDDGNQTRERARNRTRNVTLVAVAHRDTNENREFDYLASRGAEDQPYPEGMVIDEAVVTVGPNESANATEKASARWSAAPG